MKVLIDGDIIRYSCGFASDQYEYEVGGVVFSGRREASKYCEANGIDKDVIKETIEPEPVEFCLHSVKKLIGSIVEKTGAHEYEVFLTGKGNFREELATLAPYKGTRSTRKPYWYKEIGTYLKEKHGAIEVTGQEADDAMGIAQCQTLDTTCIASLDKDMDMIPGEHYNWRKDQQYSVTVEDALMAFYKQLLTGDRSDNIPGIHGVGPIKAAKMLSDCKTEEEMWERVLEEYSNRTHYSYKDVLQIARLLWIRREPDQTWEPPETS
jgi:5'-3' exonuclease